MSKNNPALDKALETRILGVPCLAIKEPNGNFSLYNLRGSRMQWLERKLYADNLQAGVALFDLEFTWHDFITEENHEHESA